ncbi:MAG: acetyl-CoA carboxylase biotin carboxyl carrier protein subunit [Capsulimonadales bacterium]|nr:acetyl-CoA carboxylase biotin carboxyl carrier protein subunit [Capsulimonadales bacterium]
MSHSLTSPEENRTPELAATADNVRRLASLVEESGLSELLYETDNVRIVLRTAAYPRTGTNVAVPSGATGYGRWESPETPSVAEEPDGDAEPPTMAEDGRWLRVEAPIMGIFYRASSQGSPPLVEVGDTLTEGQVIGLIEAMKVFSEVPSPAAGRVIDIPARNGGLVQPGDTLILLERE